MEGDDETMSTITVSIDEDPCSDGVLKPLKSIWDCVFMKKDNHDNNWTCGHCNLAYSKINATKALAHLLSIPDLHIAACKDSYKIFKSIHRSLQQVISNFY